MGIAAVRMYELPRLAAPGGSGPVAGENGFVPYGALTDPLSQGLPPVVPSLITRMVSTASKREVRTAGNDLSTRPLTGGGVGRARVRVEWGNVTVTQRAALTSWMRDVLWMGESGARFGFTVKLDGADAGSSGSEVMTVRPLGAWQAVSEQLRQEVVGIECEQVG